MPRIEWWGWRFVVVFERVVNWPRKAGDIQWVLRIMYSRKGRWANIVKPLYRKCPYFWKDHTGRQCCRVWERRRTKERRVWPFATRYCAPLVDWSPRHPRIEVSKTSRPTKKANPSPDRPWYIVHIERFKSLDSVYAEESIRYARERVYRISCIESLATARIKRTRSKETTPICAPGKTKTRRNRLAPRQKES